MIAQAPVLDAPDAVLQDGPSDLAEGRLRGNAYLALKNVSCDYREGILVLRGQVPTYYLKQVATAAVAGLPGVRHIVNQIDVAAG